MPTLSIARLALTAALICSFALAPAHAEDFPGADVKARLDSFATAKDKSPEAAVKALIAMETSERPEDLDLLLELAVRDTDRIVRLAALSSVRAIDDDKGLAFFKGKADAKDILRTVFATEGIQHLGSKKDMPQLLELAKSSDLLIAAAALRAMPRLATKKQIDKIMDVSLRAEDVRMSDYGAWAVQDLVKKVDAAVKRYEKIAKKKKDERGERAASIVALLEDELSPPHVWGDSLKEVREAILEAPAEVPVTANNTRHKAKVESTLQWMRDNAPTAAYTVRVAAKTIEVTTDNKFFLDAEKGTLFVPVSFSARADNKLAWHINIVSGVLLQDRMGNPHIGHRGWELPLFDSYDFSVIAKLFDVGPAGMSRGRYLNGRLEKRPWGGQ